jgi:hypothetical protein
LPYELYPTFKYNASVGQKGGTTSSSRDPTPGTFDVITSFYAVDN